MNLKFTKFLFGAFFLSSCFVSAQSTWGADEKNEIEQLLGIQFTGNTVQDAQTYEQAKNNLKVNNPQAFTAFYGSPESIDGYLLIPGFNFSGIPVQDMQNYKLAKINLFNNNKPLYDHYFPVRNTAQVRMTQQEYSQLPVDKKADVDAVGVYFIDGQ